MPPLCILKKQLFGVLRLGHLSVCLCACMSMCLSVSGSVYLSDVCLSVCLPALSGAQAIVTAVENSGCLVQTRTIFKQRKGKLVLSLIQRKRPGLGYCLFNPYPGVLLQLSRTLTDSAPVSLRVPRVAPHSSQSQPQYRVCSCTACNGFV